MTAPTEPLLTYQERLPQVRREFRLFRDRVEIDAQWTFGRHHHTIVKLADLSGRFEQFTVRNKWFKRSILIGALAISAALVFARGNYAPAVRKAAGLGWPIAGMCAVVAVMSARNRQFVHFPRKDGRPGLDICRTNSERFQDFLREVQKRAGKA